MDNKQVCDILANKDSSWIPLGSKTMVKGTIVEDEPVMVNIGAGIYLEMNKDDAIQHFGGMSVSSANDPPESGQNINQTTLPDGEIEIMEPFSMEDAISFERKGKARIAHTVMCPVDKKEKAMLAMTSEPTKESIDGIDECLTPNSPIKERVVERDGIAIHHHISSSGSRTPSLFKQSRLSDKRT